MECKFSLAERVSDCRETGRPWNLGTSQNVTLTNINTLNLGEVKGVTFASKWLSLEQDLSVEPRLGDPKLATWPPPPPQPPRTAWSGGDATAGSD